VTKEEREATIRALLAERRGYELRGESERVAEVDAELRRLGHEAAKPQARAERRPAARRGGSR
jgi:hypothetical protein